MTHEDIAALTLVNILNHLTTSERFYPTLRHALLMHDPFYCLPPGSCNSDYQRLSYASELMLALDLPCILMVVGSDSTPDYEAVIVCEVT